MIIDSHTHLYDPTRPGGVPWPPEDSSIYRTVLPEHFRAVSSSLGVTGTVVVEASPLLEDNQWVLDLAENEFSIVGFIGNLDLRDPSFKNNLNRFAENPIFRGVRARGYSVAELLEDAVHGNLRFLSEKNSVLEVLVQPDEMDLAITIARRHPDLTIILDHVAHVAIDGSEPSTVWKEGVIRCAGCPRIVMKLSRLPECSTEWPATQDPEHYRPAIEWMWNAFGSSRLLWGSNWPVAEFASDYATTLSVVLDFLKDKPDDERQDVLWRTSQATYGWNMERLNTGAP